jgi:hypothetical protein
MSDLLLENGDYSQGGLVEMLDSARERTVQDMHKTLDEDIKKYIVGLLGHGASREVISSNIQSAAGAMLVEATREAAKPAAPPVATLDQVRTFLDNFMRKYTCKLRKADAGLWLPDIMNVFKSWVLKTHGLVVEQGPESLGAMICHRSKSMFYGNALTPVRMNGGPTVGYMNLRYKSLKELAEKSGHSVEKLSNRRK